MTDKELRRLSRQGLLEVLIAQTKETEKYKAQAEKLQAELDEQKRSYSEIGSLAGEAMKVSGVYEAAQAAADKYLEEIERLKAEAEAEHDRIIAEAKAESDSLMKKTKNLLNKRIREVNEYAAGVNAGIEAYFEAHPEIRNQSEKQENTESESEDEEE